MTVEPLEIALHGGQRVLRAAAGNADDRVVLHGLRLRGPLDSDALFCRSFEIGISGHQFSSIVVALGRRVRFYAGDFFCRDLGIAPRA